jgi:hypothetical protein
LRISQDAVLGILTNSPEIREFSGSHRSEALYQGTTLVGP